MDLEICYLCIWEFHNINITFDCSRCQVLHVPLHIIDFVKKLQDSRTIRRLAASTAFYAAFHIPALQGWISWIICWIHKENCFMALDRRKARDLQLSEFIVIADGGTSESWLVGWWQNHIQHSNSPFKVQLNLISSQRPWKLGSVISFTFIFSCYL